LLLHRPATRDQQWGAGPVDRTHPQITQRTASLVGWMLLTPPVREATLSQFVPWKSRSKIVLEETNQKTVEEHDLGLAVPPDRLMAIAPIELASSPHSIHPPLRC